MEGLLLPSKIELIPDNESKNKATFVVEPCFHGYGTTIGNALRRVMLSSLPGAAVTAVKIKGAQHEFSTIDGIKEDVLEIILNLKGLRLKLFSDEPVRLRLSKSGSGKVTAKDIEKSSDVEIANPELHIATISDKNGELEMEIIVAKGRGYQPVEDRTKEKAELGVISIDALFSPVREVGYRVENVRVGQVTNFDKLMLTIETDGTVTPREAVDQALSVLIDHFNLLLSENGKADMVSTNEDEGDGSNDKEDSEEGSEEEEAENKKSKKKK